MFNLSIAFFLFTTNKVSTLRVSYGKSSSGCAQYGSHPFPVTYRWKWFYEPVQVHFECPSSTNRMSLCFWARHFPWGFSHKLIFLTCPCAFLLRRLAQNMRRILGVRHFFLAWNGYCEMSTCILTAQARTNCGSRSWDRWSASTSPPSFPLTSSSSTSNFFSISSSTTSSFFHKIIHLIFHNIIIFHLIFANVVILFIMCFNIIICNRIFHLIIINIIRFLLLNIILPPYLSTDMYAVFARPLSYSCYGIQKVWTIATTNKTLRTTL